MRLSIRHETTYRYESPATYAIQTLRLTPRSHDGQFVSGWRIDIDRDCRLDKREDAFGNVTHTFSIDGSIGQLSIVAVGDVETQDTHGVVRGVVERFPPAIYLRETDLTAADRAIIDFADEIGRASASDPLSALHRLMAGVSERMEFDKGATETTTTAAEAFAAGHGVCQDLSHVFISAARRLGIPTRYVGGYLFRSDGENKQDAGHAWAEAFVDGLGWVGFDPANCICPTDAHVRVAVALDCLGATPVRGVRYGGLEEQLSVKVSLKAR
ncbi:MAG: transglutaminase family protein [Hyphomicrobiales bacterium]